MEVQYNNLFTHFVFTVENRQPVIKTENRESFAEEFDKMTAHYCQSLTDKGIMGLQRCF